MPDSMRSCGVRMVPQQTMTSRLANNVSPVVSTIPVAFLKLSGPSSSTIFLTVFSLMTSTPLSPYAFPAG